MKNHDNIVEDSNYMVFSSIKLDKASDRKNFNTVLKKCVTEVNRTANKITKMEVKHYNHKNKVNPETLSKISPWFYKVLQGGITKLINKGISSRDKKKEVNYDIHKVKKSLAFCKTLSTSPELRPTKRKIKIPKFNLNVDSSGLPIRKDSDDILSLTPQNVKIFPFTSRHQNQSDDNSTNCDKDKNLLIKTHMEKKENNYYVTNIKGNKNFSVRKSLALPAGTILKLPMMNLNLMQKSDCVTDRDFSHNSGKDADNEISMKSESSLIHLGKQEIDPNDKTNRSSRPVAMTDNGILKKAPILKRMGTMINTNNFSEKFISMKSLENLDNMNNQKGSRNSKMYMYNIFPKQEASAQENEDTKLTDLAYLDTSHRSRGSNTNYQANNLTEDTSLTSRSNYKTINQTYEHNENKNSSNKTNYKSNRVSWLDISNFKKISKDSSDYYSPEKGEKITNSKNIKISSIPNPTSNKSESDTNVIYSESVGMKHESNSHSRNYLQTHKSSIINKLLTTNTEINKVPSNLKLISKEKKDNFDTISNTILNNSSNTGNTCNNSQTQFSMSKTGVLPKFKKTHLNNFSNCNKTHQNFHTATAHYEFYATNPRFHLPNQNKFEKTFDDMLKEKSLLEGKIKKGHIMLPDKKLFIDKTEASIRNILGCDFAPKILDGVVSHSTGMTSYIEKCRADLLKCSDTLSRMNPLSLVRMGGKFVNRYEEYSKAADLDECVEREYKPYNLERLDRNQIILKKISRSISQSQKKVHLKKNKPK